MLTVAGVLFSSPRATGVGRPLLCSLHLVHFIFSCPSVFLEYAGWRESVPVWNYRVQSFVWEEGCFSETCQWTRYLRRLVPPCYIQQRELLLVQSPSFDMSRYRPDNADLLVSRAPQRLSVIRLYSSAPFCLEELFSDTIRCCLSLEETTKNGHILSHTTDRIWDFTDSLVE